MTRTRSQRIRRGIVRITVAALALAVAALACFLPFAGTYLVVQQPLEHADAIVVLAGPRAERWLEACRPVSRRVGAHASCSAAGASTMAKRRLSAIGIRFPQDADLARDAMLQMNVPASAIVLLPESLDNTAQEAASTRRIAVASGWSRIIVVTSAYHSRRAGYAFAREFRGTPMRHRDANHALRFGAAGAMVDDQAGVRYVTSELQKLAAYRLGLSQ